MERSSAPESLGHLGQAIAASPIPLFVCNLADQRIVLANSAAAELFVSCGTRRPLQAARTPSLRS
jgi:PAS domain-containing protein